MQENKFQDLVKNIGEIGYIQKVVGSIVYVDGLPFAKPNELVVFESGELGQVASLDREYVEIFAFQREPLKIGKAVARTNKTLEIMVGDSLLGQIIDPLGNRISTPSQVKEGSIDETRSIFSPPQGIVGRVRITKGLETGVALADCLVPLGKGQREIILGDGNTGKSTFAFQTIVSQAKLGTVCIYASIGKKQVSIKRAEKYFQENGVSERVIVVASGSEYAPSLIYLTPYTAMTIAEYFRDKGQDVLLVLDDLTTHARYYRELSLLGGRFPGRESYPGDIFHVHAELLERAGNFSGKNGQASSITCLPVIAMPGNNFGYIQTNLISITDGHIFFDSDLFSRGRRPAINPFLSVSRVGHQTQSTVYQGASREILSFLSFYDKIQAFVRFGAEMTDKVKESIEKGERLTAFFGQSLHVLMPVNIQVYILALIWKNKWFNKTIDEMKNEIDKLIADYLKKSKFAQKVNTLVDESSSWNEFLEKVDALDNGQTSGQNNKDAQSQNFKKLESGEKYHGAE